MMSLTIARREQLEELLAEVTGQAQAELAKLQDTELGNLGVTVYHIALHHGKKSQNHTWGDIKKTVTGHVKYIQHQLQASISKNINPSASM